MNIKLTKTDILFSRYIRLLADGICECCHKNVGVKRLECAHFHGRVARSTRWDRQNVAALCFTCHNHFHAEPLEQVEFFMGRMSRPEFEALDRKAHTTRQWRSWEILDLEADLKLKIKKLEEGE